MNFSSISMSNKNLKPPLVATHDSSTATHEPELTIDEPSSPHSAIYIPGRRSKRMARMNVSTTTHVKKDLDLNADDDSFLEEGSAEDWPEGSFNVLVRWEVSCNGQTNTIYRLDNPLCNSPFSKKFCILWINKIFSPFMTW